MVEKDGTQIIYLRGNHDDFFAKNLPVAFGKLKICEEYISR